MGATTPVSEALQQLFRSCPLVRFVQIGCNDGISTDPIREFVIRNQHWRGVFVEPIQVHLDRCRYNYSFYSPERFSFVNAAVSEHAGVLDIWKVKDSELHKFPRLAGLVASVDCSHVLKFFPNAGQTGCLERFTVHCTTYPDVVRQAGFAALEFLLIDVEGHEASIIRSLRDAPIRPAAILFETAHLSDAELQEVQVLLNSLSYSLHQLGCDCLATHDAAVDSTRR
jgi:FkbM family methyltransferase